MDFLDVMNMATPIGPIPANYTHLSRLCKKAHIFYKDETVTTDGTLTEKVKDPTTGQTVVRRIPNPEKRSFRRWFVAYDSMKHPRKHKTPTGKVRVDQNQMQDGTVEHAKFCMVLEYIAARGERNIQDAGLTGKLDRRNILDLAIGIAQDLYLPDGSTVELGRKVTSLFMQSPDTLADELRAAGVKGYERRTVAAEAHAGVEEAEF